MKCTGKEWDHCRVEKMGCTGCYYDDDKEIKILKNYVREWHDTDVAVAIEKILKENEQIKIKNKAIKNESNAYAKEMKKNT